MGQRQPPGYGFAGCLLLMARIPKNSLLHGISGKLGNLVLRQVGGQTVVQAAEAPGRRAPRSPAQQAHLDRMYRAQLYAKAQVRDPTAKARYTTGIDQRRRSAYAVAIADYMHAPEITAVDMRSYHGQPGDPIFITATDDFAVAGVSVCLRDAGGALLEEGPAEPLATSKGWRYTTRTAAGSGQQVQVEAEACDYAGNVARLAATVTVLVR